MNLVRIALRFPVGSTAGHTTTLAWKEKSPLADLCAVCSSNRLEYGWEDWCKVCRALKKVNAEKVLKKYRCALRHLSRVHNSKIARLCGSACNRPRVCGNLTVGKALNLRCSQSPVCDRHTFPDCLSICKLNSEFGGLIS
jgi:hypothetical protein